MFEGYQLDGTVLPLVLGILVILWIVNKASKDPNSPVSWDDFIVDPETNKASVYRLGYLFGGMISSWVICSLTLSDRLTGELLLIYLTYLIGGASWSAYLNNKKANQ